MLDDILAFVKKFIPKQVFNALRPYYHLCLAYLAAAVTDFRRAG